jgi:hypothetical protein
MDYFSKLAGAIGGVANGVVFKRSDVYDHLVASGYSERTAINAVTPSRRGGLINHLLESGAVQKHGPNGYKVIDASKVGKKVTARAARNFSGCPRDDWEDLGWAMVGTPVEYKMSGLKTPKGWQIKVYAVGEAPSKANYWMFYAGGKLSGRDAATMARYMPDLYDSVIEQMNELGD